MPNRERGFRTQRGFRGTRVENTDMIVDEIRNASLYYALGQRIETALRYLESADMPALEPGRHEIGGGCFAIVQDYSTAPREQKRWEAHRDYIDVQFIASGREFIGYADIETLQLLEDYDAAKDVSWHEGDGSFVTARAGAFMILYPHDAHMPGVAIDGPEAVRKVVVKVPVK
jgi:biofilm protein TabA